MRGLSALRLFVVAVFGFDLRHSRSVPEIRLAVDDSCRTAVQIEWLVLETDEGLINCTIFYDTAENFSRGIAQTLDTYSLLKRADTLKIKGLTAAQNYSLQIICSSVSSEVLNFSVSDNDCSFLNKDDSTPSNDVVFYKEQTSFLGTKDSVVGIVFGLFGLLIIIVTSFYVLRKVRRRQRLERIRRYLGSSLIDPFQNMEEREPGTGSERLIEDAAES